MRERVRARPENSGLRENIEFIVLFFPTSSVGQQTKIFFFLLLLLNLLHLS